MCKHELVSKTQGYEKGSLTRYVITLSKALFLKFFSKKTNNKLENHLPPN